MRESTQPKAAVRRISIQDYKGIEELELELPRPRMKSDPDVMVIGSQNGLGKTSILECCSLLLSTLTVDWKQFPIVGRKAWPVDLPDFLIRAGAERLELDAEMSTKGQEFKLSFHLDRHGDVGTTSNRLGDTRGAFRVTGSSESALEDLIGAIAGISADPVLADSFLLFHSYRKVQEGNPELGMIAEERPFRPVHFRRKYEFAASRFKTTILRSLMQQAGLFELSESENQNAARDRLNELLEFYAGGKISKLRPREDNSVDIRIQPSGGGESFTFDGLSSGQKEIISTLFLIWYHTHDHPSVVLIDAPELHLNVQWHRSFINGLFDLAPLNQYIVATHSVDVMDSVEEDRRLLLSE